MIAVLVVQAAQTLQLATGDIVLVGKYDDDDDNLLIYINPKG